MAKKTNPKSERFTTTERVTKVQDPRTGRLTKVKKVVITKQPGAPSTPAPEPVPTDAA